tara:strand:+ start:24 stop:662 length:639 start_codon:yes stop_codon:yes gene_type:complete
MNLSLPEAIQQGAKQLQVAVNDEQAERLARLLQRILKANERINIIGPCTLEQAVERHLLDSLALMRLLEHSKGLTSWIDIGSGGGFPGLVWALMRPDLDLLLVDSVGKKAALARKHAIELGLKNVKVRPSRFEELPAPREPKGLVSRATFAPLEWIERGTDFLSEGGVIVATMGGQADSDVLAKAAVVDRLTLPPSALERTNVLVEVEASSS